MNGESYVYKKEVDWSLLTAGLTVTLANQVVFGQIMGRFLRKGESKSIKLYLNGKAYPAKVQNVNFGPKHKRKSDVIQIRYSKNSELAKELQSIFSRSFNYIREMRENRIVADGKRGSQIRLPEGAKEYLTIYTTVDDDTYILDTIFSDDIALLKEAIKDLPEKEIENKLSYNGEDPDAGFYDTPGLRKIRKLNQSIGDNLKLLYGYRCQICGNIIGEEYGSHFIEAHHIEYFKISLNNDASNQMIVCPNHHSIIHDMDPVFDREKKLYLYPNGMEQRLALNFHL